MMTTQESNDSNLLDAETINLRLIIYPVLAVLILILGGFGYYYYAQNQRDEHESAAAAAIQKAKTPEEFAQVADQYANTDHAILALLEAGHASFDKHDYDSAVKYYQRILSSSDVQPQLHDTAQLGLASSLEASGKADDAINTYLLVARLGNKSPFAAYAYSSAARIYDQRGDKDNERKILTEATSLDPDSPFVKQAQGKLQELSAQNAPINLSPTPAQ